jgi:hypothetical protein
VRGHGIGPIKDREPLEELLDLLGQFRAPGFLRAETELRSRHHRHAKLLSVLLEAVEDGGWTTLDDVARDIRIQHPEGHNGSRA